MPDELTTLDAAPQTIEVRSVERREIAGRIFPYNVTIRVRGREERFTRGSLSGVDWSRTRLLRNHDPRQPLGRMIALEEREDGAYGVFRVAQTEAGDEALALASEGVLEFSPGFLDDDLDGTHRRVRALPEVSLVTFATYPQPPISVREGAPPMPTEPTPESTPTTTSTPDNVPVFTEEQAAELERRHQELMQAIQRIEAAASAPAPSAPRISPLEWFHAEVQRRHNNNPEPYHRLEERFEELRTRALADVTGGEDGPAGSAADDGSDLTGTVVEEYVASQLVNVLDARRPLFRSFGSFPAIRSGYARIPIVTGHVTVGDRGAQKSEVPSQAPTVTTQLFEAEWGAGAVDIALELIRTAELPVLQFIWEDFLAAYAIYLENKSRALLEADDKGWTYTGEALTYSDYATFARAVAEASMAVREATGAPATRLAVPKDLWLDLVSAVDASDRRQFSSGDHSDGTVTLTAESLNLTGGITAFYAPGITRAYAYNEAAIRAVDYGPERFDALNVAQMGQDVGLLGRHMLVPRIPAGVVVFDTEPA